MHGRPIFFVLPVTITLIYVYVYVYVLTDVHAYKTGQNYDRSSDSVHSVTFHFNVYKLLVKFISLLQQLHPTFNFAHYTSAVVRPRPSVSTAQRTLAGI